jgi:hypothetical protein
MELLPSDLNSSAAGASLAVAEADRVAALGMLVAAEEAFVELGAPSPLGTVLFSGCVADMGISQGDGVWGVAAGISLMGYACRLANGSNERPSHLAGMVEAGLPLSETGEIDYEALCEDRDLLPHLAERVGALAADASAITTLAGCTSDAWRGFATMATSQLRRSFLRHGLPSDALPPLSMCETLLRLGYALRFVDEIAGERPAAKSRRAPDARLPLPDPPDEDGAPPNGLGIDVDAWAAETTAMCFQDFTPLAERLLESAPLAVFGISSLHELADDDTAATAVAAARFGYALRNRECSLIPGAWRPGDDGALMTELDRRGCASARADDRPVDLLSDVIRYGYCGGADALLKSLPGATPQARRAAFAVSIDRFPDGDSHPTLALIHYGYLLHRLFERSWARHEGGVGWSTRHQDRFVLGVAGDDDGH